MNDVLFRYIVISDLHLCIEPRRRNALELLNRNPLKVLSSIGALTKQVTGHGLTSILVPASYDPEVLSGVARFCKDWEQKAEGVILTGDLCTTGLMADLNVGMSFLSSPNVGGVVDQNGFPTIAQFGNQISLLPGNHDRYADVGGTPNGRNFDLQLGGYMPGWRNRIGYWVDTKARRSLAFVMADFCLEKKADLNSKQLQLKGYMGRGIAYPSVIDDMRKQTSLLREKYSGCKVVWVVHFAPYQVAPSLELVEWKKLIDAAELEKIDTILCGHTHEQKKVTDGGVSVYCSGSACSVEPVGNQAVHLLEFRVSQQSLVVTRTNYAWNSSESAFELAGQTF